MITILQHHPDRVELLERSAHLSPIVVADPEPTGKRNTWRTYRACLQVGAGLQEPFVILQDDCIPVPGFAETAELVRKALPEALIAFCLQGMIHSTTRTAFYQALAGGRRLLRVQPHNWVPAMALGWTPALAGEALRWDVDVGQKRLREQYSADDARLFYFVRWAQVELWATVPSLVDHPDDVPSVKGGNGKGKRAFRTLHLLTDDPRKLSGWETR